MKRKLWYDKNRKKNFSGKYVTHLKKFPSIKTEAEIFFSLIYFSTKIRAKNFFKNM